MARTSSIIIILSMVFSIAAANSGAKVFCSHHDGFGHVISQESHEKEVHASCVYQHADQGHATHDHSHNEADCEDVELVDSELEDLSSNSDRGKSKVPTNQLVADIFSSCPLIVFAFAPARSALFVRQCNAHVYSSALCGVACRFHPTGCEMIPSV